jgi:hypothetical protein
MKDTIKSIRRLIQIASFGLLVAAVIKELRTPASERTWHGKIAGIFPYDLRIPTPGRLRQAMWNPENPHLLVPTAFGVGWSLNLHALMNLAQAG